LFIEKKKMNLSNTQANLVDDFHPLTEEIWKSVRRFTMTDKKRVNALINAVEYTIRKDIPGDFVECGVWRGGSIMTMIKTLQLLGVERRVWLYDTFEGMSEPTEVDTHRGKNGNILMKTNPNNRCIAELDRVKKGIESLNYGGEVNYVQGKVEDTIPVTLPGKIGLLRLDTDWYESTRHEMLHLYPLLEKDGILIVDDYNWWDGSTQAINEYFEGQDQQLTRISTCGILTIKSQS